MKPSRNPVSEARDRGAKRSALHQYADAESKHRQAGNELMVEGYFGLAGAEFNTADMIQSVALEELTAKPLTPGAW